jgi:hypothetical protein
LSSAVAVFLDSLAGGSLEQPPNAARVSTRKQKMHGLRFIPGALAFETLSTESEGITGHRRHTRDAEGSRENINENAGADSPSPSWDIAAETPHLASGQPVLAEAISSGTARIPQRGQ